MQPLVFLLGFLFLLASAGCHREPQPEKPRTRPQAAKLPPAYDSLPRVTEQYYRVGSSTYCLLIISAPGKELPCSPIDSIVVLAATPEDSLYRRVSLLEEANGLCLADEAPDAPPIAVEAVAQGQHHVLILRTWAGGNAGSSFTTFVWLLPEGKLVIEQEGLSRTFRLTPDSLLALAIYDAFLPDDIEVPNASLAYPVASFYVLEPALSPQQLQQVWNEFLERERQRAMREYESDHGLLWAAVDYIVYSRLLGRPAEAETFLQRALREAAATPEERAYLRAAARNRITPTVATWDIILQAPRRLP